MSFTFKLLSWLSRLVYQQSFSMMIMQLLCVYSTDPILRMGRKIEKATLGKSKTALTLNKSEFTSVGSITKVNWS